MTGTPTDNMSDEQDSFLPSQQAFSRVDPSEWTASVGGPSEGEQPGGHSDCVTEEQVTIFSETLAKSLVGVSPDTVARLFSDPASLDL